jgi:methionyl-tRNA synthetase
VVTIDEFRRIHLRIGTILSAEPVPKAAKLFRLKVDIGEASPRQLVAGIAEHYQAETLVGKQVVVVANLRPAVIRGIESHGMILAADTDCGLALLEPDKAAPNGQPIR